MSGRWWQRPFEALVVAACFGYYWALRLPLRARRVVGCFVLRCGFALTGRGPAVWRRWSSRLLLALVRHELRISGRELARAEAEMEALS